MASKIVENCAEPIDVKLIDRGIDPLKLEETRIYRAMNDGSKKKYLATWRSFCTKFDIKLGKPPTEENFHSFLEELYDNGKAHSTISSVYSHLNTAVETIYARKLEIWPMLYKFLKLKGKKCDAPVKAKPFEEWELEKYYTEADLNNGYDLVRGGIGIAGFFGTNRMGEVKAIKFGGKYSKFCIFCKHFYEVFSNFQI